MKNVFKKFISVLLVAIMMITPVFLTGIMGLEMMSIGNIVGLNARAEESDNMLTFDIKFYTCDELGNWNETTFAEPGETVKARLFINTNYPTASGQLYLLYSTDFFEHNYLYSERYTPVFNSSATSSSAINMASGTMSLLDSSNIRYESMIYDGYIPEEYAGKYHIFNVIFRFGTYQCNYISDEEWFVEFELKVKDNVTEDMCGEFFVDPALIYTPERSDMYFGIDIPVGTLGSSGLSAVSLSNIQVNSECRSSFINLKKDSSDENLIWNFDETTGTLTINGTRDMIDWSDFYSSPLADIRDLIEFIIFEEDTAPVKEGHTFIGWAPLFPETAPDSDITLTEVFEVNSYTIKWIVDESITTETYEYGSEITVPADPEKDDYFFTGWTPAIPLKMPAKDLTFTAKFTDYNANNIKIEIIKPESRTINYGESITLYINSNNLPSDAKIKWIVDGEGVTIEPSVSGKICKVTSSSTGNVVIKAYVVDSNGNIIKDSNGKQIFDSEYFYSEANLWLRIVYFFRKLLGISLTTTQFIV